MPHSASNAGCMIAGFVCAVISAWPAIGAEKVPDFSSDSRTGWIARVPDATHRASRCATLCGQSIANETSKSLST